MRPRGAGGARPPRPRPVRPHPDERHLLRSVALLDAFDLDLATRAAGLTQQAPARRLTERPLITENPYALWPYHLHRAIRSAVRDDNHSEDRWTPADWHHAANPRPGRPRLIEAAFVYTDDSVWEHLTLPTASAPPTASPPSCYLPS
ncbi:hypothetical protein [Streptomyces sp. NPDC051014]|uniref:hypothetical protein n=1 Tax=Streptomyces sp. NPDC051014 TaxID=3155751 RepID=UPI0033CB2141